MKNKILEKITQIPTLPESIIKIEAIYNDENSNFNDIVKVLEKDPLLIADVLKMANSPLYGFSREIKEISQAIALFGMGTVRGFVLANLAKQTFNLDLSPYNISNENFINLSKKEHTLMTAWCIRKENKLMSILSPAIFLIEIGKVIISKEIIETNQKDKFQKLLKENQNINEVEKEMIGMTTIEVSSLIFEQWNFEKNLIDVIKNCDTPENATTEENKRIAMILKVVRTCININNEITEENLEKSKELIKKYNLDLSSFEKAIELQN